MADQRQQVWPLTSQRNRDWAKQQIDRVSEKWECVLRPPNRTDKQNRRLHALINAIIEHKTEFAGRTWDINSWRRIFIGGYLIARQDEPPTMIIGLEGEVVLLHERSTTDLSTKEMAEMQSYIEAKMAEWGVPWVERDNPYPDDYYDR